MGCRCPKQRVLSEDPFLHVTERETALFPSMSASWLCRTSVTSLTHKHWLASGLLGPGHPIAKQTGRGVRGESLRHGWLPPGYGDPGYSRMRGASKGRQETRVSQGPAAWLGQPAGAHTWCQGVSRVEERLQEGSNREGQGKGGCGHAVALMPLQQT